MKGLDKLREAAKEGKEGKDVDAILEDVVAARRAGQSPQELFGGPRDWLDAALPSAGFFLGHLIGGLRPGIYAAIAVEVVIILVRLVRKETLRHAFSGAFGVAISAFFAAKTGESKGFFLKDIIINALYGVGFLLSVVFRHPMVGVIMRLVQEKPKEWHEHPRVKRAYAEATLGWAGVFLLRLAVQVFFYRDDSVGGLAVAKIIMGYPLFIAALALTVHYVRRRTRDVPVPESPPEGEAEAGGEDAGDDAPQPVGDSGGA